MLTRSYVECRFLRHQQHILMANKGKELPLPTEPNLFAVRQNISENISSIDNLHKTNFEYAEGV